MKRFLVCVAFAYGVFAPAIDIRRLFHRLALRAAILACRYGTGTDWVCALFGFRGVHLFPPRFKQRTGDPSLDASRQDSEFLCRTEQIAILVAPLL
jgi:hypothetical protein